MTEGKMEEVGAIDIFINPGKPLPEVITQITGITDADLAEAPDEKQAFAKVKAFMGDNPVLSGYNVSFDIRFLQAFYETNGEVFDYKLSLDVLTMAKENFPKPHKLINTCENLGIADKFTFHRSIDDARATLEVLKLLITKYDKAPTAIVDITSVSRWNKHGFNRIYVSNKQKASIYYDAINKVWSLGAEYDEDAIKKSVYDFVGVTNDDELDEKVV